MFKRKDADTPHAQDSLVDFEEVEEKAKKPRKAWFGRKNKDEGVDEAREKPAKPAKHKKRSRNELLSSVLDESVVETSMAELKGNPTFMRIDGGETKYYGLLLDTNDIGGLSRKAASRNEAKGSIVECISSGRIKVIVTPALMADDSFILIPDASTLEAADEFSLLREAPYNVAIISEGLASIDVGPKVSFDDVKDVSDGKLTLDDLLGTGANVMPDVPEIDDLPIDVDEGPSFARAVNSLHEDDIPQVMDDLPIQIDETQAFAAVGGKHAASQMPSEPVQPPTNLMPAPQQVAQESVAPSAQPVQQPVQQQEQPPEPQDVFTGDAADVFSFEDMAESITRMFYSEDIPFEVSMKPFDQAFVANNHFEGFPEDRGEGWLAEQLSQMSKDANADLSRVHSDNLRYLRERYTHLMGMYIDGLISRLAMDSPSTFYGAQKIDVDTSHKQAVANIDSRVRSQIDELEAAFDKRVQEHGDAARTKAEDDYKTKHRHSHQSELAHVRSRVQAEIEAEYQSQLEEIIELRRSEAAKRIDFGVTAILNTLAEEYSEMCKAERERFDAYRKAFAKWMDDNRKEDVAYAQALAEEQRQGERTETLRREYDAQLAALRSELEQRRDKYAADLAELEAMYDKRVRDINDRHDVELARVDADRDAALARINDMQDKLNDVARRKDDEYAQRITTYEERITAAKGRYEDLQDQHRRTSVLWIALAVIGIVASGCVGVIIGLHQSIDYSMSMADGAILAAQTLGFL